MSRISYENKNGKNIIINKLEYPEAINARLHNLIADGYFEDFLPVHLYQKGKETRIMCEVSGLIPISQYFNSSVSKKLFLEFVYQLSMVIKNCEENRINISNLELQKNMIFIDPKTHRIKCVFWPLVNNKRSSSAYLFFKQFPYGLCFNINENNDYLRSYKSFFDNNVLFSIHSFEKLLVGLFATSNLNGINVSLDKKNIFSNKNLHTLEQKNIEYNPFIEDEKIINSSVIDGVVLIRCKTDDVIYVTKKQFRIGSEPKESDLVLHENFYISRNHADIIIRNGKYYVVDHHSKNKTFVDGKIVPAEVEVEIVSGSRLRFADEDFVFSTEYYPTYTHKGALKNEL